MGDSNLDRALARVRLMAGGGPCNLSPDDTEALTSLVQALDVMLAAEEIEADSADTFSQADLDNEREKYREKAAVYGALAARFREALEAIAAPGSEGVTSIAKEALAWRHSSPVSGVPRSAVEEIDRLLSPEAAPIGLAPNLGAKWVARYLVEGENVEAWLARARSTWVSTDDIRRRHRFASKAEAEAAIDWYGGLVGGDWDAVELNTPTPHIEPVERSDTDRISSLIEAWCDEMRDRGVDKLYATDARYHLRLAIEGLVKDVRKELLRADLPGGAT